MNAARFLWQCTCALLCSYSCAHLLGCAPASGLPYAFVANGFTAHEIEVLQSAADEWSDKTGGKFQAVVLPPGVCPGNCSSITKVLSLPGAWGQCSATREVEGVERAGSSCVQKVHYQSPKRFFPSFSPNIFTSRPKI